MPTLNPDLAYKQPAVPEALVSNEPLPEDWLKTLIEAIKAHHESKTSSDLEEKMKHHVGDQCDYEMKGQVIEGLKAIYRVMMDPETNSDHKSSIAFKFIERAENCTPGFHDGVNSMVDGFTRPASLDELLYRIRHDIVSKTANQTTDEVHANNRFYTIAQSAGYGVKALNPNDVYLGRITDRKIFQKLQDAFARDYRFFSVLSCMEDQIRSELLRLEYTGPRDAGYESARMERFIDFLTTLFKDAPAVIKQREAIALAEAQKKEYCERMNEAMNPMRSKVCALIPALIRQELIDALIRNAFPAPLKTKYINVLSSETEVEIAKIQSVYKEFTESEDMRALLPSPTHSTDDQVSPFQLTDESDHLHLNWNQIRRTLREEFCKQRYFNLTGEEENALNEFLGNTQTLKNEHFDVLALDGQEVMSILSSSMLSDKQKQDMLGWYILDEKEPVEKKINSLLAIIDLSKNVLKNQALSSFLLGDKTFMLAVIKKNPSLFREASIVLQNDKAFLLDIVKQRRQNLSLISKEFKEDASFMLDAVELNPLAFEFASLNLKKNRHFMLDVVGRNHLAFRFIDTSLRDDPDFMLEAVRQNSSALKYIHETWSCDREMILKAITQSAPPLQFIPPPWNMDSRFMLEAIHLKAEALEQASPKLKNQPRFLLDAVKQNLDALRYVNKRWLKDDDFMLNAVRQNGKALDYASERLQKDPDIKSAIDAISKTRFEEILKTYQSKSISAYLSTFWIFSWISPTKSQTMIELEKLSSNAAVAEVTRGQIEEAINRGDNKKHRIRLFTEGIQSIKKRAGTDEIITALKEELHMHKS